MSERYSRLFVLPENLYAVDSPVVIAAGTLLKDNQTGKIVAQLKFRSISNKIIKAVKVRLDLLDTAGNSIGEPVVFDYLDLSASRDAEFGQKTPVPISEIKARSYAAAVLEVVFADISTWTASDTLWKSLPRQKTLNAIFGNTELVKQYKIAVGSDCTYYPLEEKDIWYCTCGTLNKKDESCNACHRTMFELQSIDLEQLAKDRDTRLAQEAVAAETKAEEERAAAEVSKRRTAKFLKIAIPVLCVVIAIALIVAKVIIPNNMYNDAVALMEAQKYEEAITAFDALDGYKDSREIRDTLRRKMVARATISAGGTHTVGLKSDGTVVVTKYTGHWQYNRGQCNTENWTDIIAVCAGYAHTIGLKSDGSVVTTKYTGSQEADFGQCNTENWKDIIAIGAGEYHTVGLKSDGTVVAVGWNGYDNYDSGQCDTENWTDIIAVSVGGSHTVGLKSDGTVVAVGSNYSNQCDINDWTDIIAISAGRNHTVGLKSDGTVVAAGDKGDGQCGVSSWANIKVPN